MFVSKQWMKKGNKVHKGHYHRNLKASLKLYRLWNVEISFNLMDLHIETSPM